MGVVREIRDEIMRILNESKLDLED